MTILNTSFCENVICCFEDEKNKGAVQPQQLKGRREGKKKEKKKKGNRSWVEATGTLGALLV